MRNKQSEKCNACSHAGTSVELPPCRYCGRAGGGYVAESRRTEMLDFAGITRRTTPPMIQRLIHASLGLTSEAGEFASAIKAYIFYDRPLDRTNMLEELGDLFWFLAQACHALGVSFEEVQQINLAKLKRRFPDRFTTDKANVRDLGGEREAMERQR